MTHRPQKDMSDLSLSESESKLSLLTCETESTLLEAKIERSQFVGNTRELPSIVKANGGLPPNLCGATIRIHYTLFIDEEEEEEQSSRHPVESTIGYVFEIENKYYALTAADNFITNRKELQTMNVRPKIIDTCKIEILRSGEPHYCLGDFISFEWHESPPQPHLRVSFDGYAPGRSVTEDLPEVIISLDMGWALIELRDPAFHHPNTYQPLNGGKLLNLRPWLPDEAAILYNEAREGLLRDPCQDLSRDTSDPNSLPVILPRSHNGETYPHWPTNKESVEGHYKVEWSTLWFATWYIFDLRLPEKDTGSVLINPSSGVVYGMTLGTLTGDTPILPMWTIMHGAAYVLNKKKQQIVVEEE